MSFTASFAALLLLAANATLASEFQRTIRTAQRKVVKIYGAGGFRQLEAYQSGILISSEGHVLTAQSYVLDTDDLAVVLHDGSKWEAEYLASDPITELALLKLPVEGLRPPHFDLESARAQSALPGERVLAMSNLYGIATGDEPVSALQGVVTAVAPLRARRGAYQSNFRGNVYVLDAYSNNPGAAGGALVDWQGRLLGVLGKELRSEVTGTWLNYALPTAAIADAVAALREGRIVTSVTTLAPVEDAHSAEQLGILLVPDVVSRTPPYVDSVRRESSAAQAGIRNDDLIVFINGEPIESQKALHLTLERLEIADPVTISVLRSGELKDFSLSALDASFEEEASEAETPAEVEP
ncbi:MAG: S1C family serine protease [Planctomycetota bacterium]